MLTAPRIVRWTLPALLLTLLVGAIFIVAAGGREGTTRPGSGADSGARSNSERQGTRRIEVHSGGAAEAIARRANFTVTELLKLNPDVDPRTLRAGQRIKIAQ